jgi:hypothetical protein
LALPAEVILLQALVTPQPEQAIQEWVGGLSAEDLSKASSQIQAYPVEYRREIMRRLSPADRSSVWRAHVAAYASTRPNLDAATLDLLKAASAALSPEIFADPTEARRASLTAVAEQLVAVIGREETVDLLARLGPRDGTFTSAEPMSMLLANKVRGLFMVNAANWDCQCSMEFGCLDYSVLCMQEIECTIDDYWPACGWGWFDPCDGLCSY